MKSKSVKNSRKAKLKAPAEQKGKIPTHDGAPENPHGKFWTLRVEAGDTVYIADNIALYVVIKNDGPGMIGLPARFGGRMKLIAGGLWATYVAGELTVENLDNKPALVQLEFVPRFN